MLRIPFSWLSAHEFELLCRDLAEEEFEEYEIHCYGENGYKQMGIDIAGRSRRGGGMIVLECKAYNQFSPKILKESIPRFLQHAEHWKAKRVHCFILCMTCNPATPKQVDSIFSYSSRLEDVGISFRLWSMTGIEAKLSRRPWLLHKYFPSIALYREPGCANGSAYSPLRYFGRTHTERKIFSLLDYFSFDTFREVMLGEDPGFGPELESLCIESCSKAFAAGLSHAKAGVWICKNLLDKGLHARSWRYRRAFSKVISKIFENCGTDEQFVVNELIEHALDSVDGAISVSAGIAVSDGSATAIPVEMLQKLLCHKHPQVRWQVLREWGLFADRLEDDQIKLIQANILGSGDHWARRRLIVSLLVRDGKSGFKNVADRNRYKELLTTELTLPSGEAFVGTVCDWLRASFGEAGSEVLSSSSSAQVGHGGTPANPNETMSDIARNIGIQCIRLDDETFRKAQEAKLCHCSEGRYGVVRKWVEDALISVPIGQSFDLAVRLLDQYDEGIRWAVGVLMPQLSTLVADHNAITIIAKKLITDEHPWVVREGLEFLARDELKPSYPKQADEIMRNASRRITHFSEHGWDEAEIMDQFLRVWARFPNSFSLRSMPI